VWGGYITDTELGGNMGNVLIQSGTIVDGTGAPAYTGDVRVRDGVIVEIGIDLVADGEMIIDATGAFVAPGIIDTHTHLDGAMWWNPELDPLPAYGNTSMVFGNCGNSIAPLEGAQRDEIVDLLCFLEDLPLEAFHKEVPWSWKTWPEYMDALRTQPTTVNLGGYLGHLALRTWVMGPDAWTRAATADEIDSMCTILDEGLASGALGLSVNHFDRDRTLRPVPGFFAGDDEYLALFKTVARHKPATVQMITRFNDPENDRLDAQRFAALAKEAGVRAQWPGIPMNVRDDERRPAVWDLHTSLQEGGSDFWPNVAFKPIAPFFGFERSIVFQRVPAWNEVLNGPAADKLPTLADPVWRDRARTDWDNRTRSSLSRLDRPNEIILAMSETGAGPIDITLAEYAEQSGKHISDALADWVLANGIASLMVGTPEKLSEADIVRALREPRTLANINDSGAHLQLFAGAGEHIYLLTHYVRDAGLISIEEGIHALTGRTADFFGLNDRGTIAVGKAGDLIVFALDELELRDEERTWDVPHGTWRFTRGPAGFRATITAGTPTWLNGGPTGARPGGVLRPVRI
jgi:N-acyl-D-amino-acid deacylase